MSRKKPWAARSLGAQEGPQTEAQLGGSVVAASPDFVSLWANRSAQRAATVAQGNLKMPDDQEIARRALDFQARARDYALGSIPAYQEWSKRKLNEGESPALIANLDARAMWLLPEQVAGVSEADFEELLADLKWTIGEA